MRRRRYLALSCTALTVAVAGCNDGDGNDDDGNGGGGGGNGDDDDGNGGGTPTPSDPNHRGFHQAVEAAGFEIDVLDVQDGTVSLDYFSEAETDDEIIEESEPILEGFAAELADGWDVDSLNVFLVDDGGQGTAFYAVQSDRVLEWHDGDVSDDEFFEEVRENVSR